MELKAKDIAKMLGVSSATVSLVLNNKPGVGEKKRQEILNKIKELGCDYLLRDSVSPQGTIGFVVYKTVGKIIDESPFFAYILEGLNQSLRKYGYSLNFVHMNRSLTYEQQCALLCSSGCKGFIIFGVEMKRTDLQSFIDTNLPFVVLDNSFQNSDVDSVAINNSQGISKAVQYSYDMGHRNIGYIRCLERINGFEERYHAYCLCLKQLGLNLSEKNICDVDYSESKIQQQIQEYLQRTEQIPSVFIAENDFIACSAMQGMQAFGLRIPEDISVIGFDDRPICQMMHPAVTTVNIPKDAFGQSAVDLLMSKMKSPRNHSVKLEIGTRLIIRNSVKDLNVSDSL